MNGLDWAAAALVAAGALLGFYRGLVSQIVSVAGLVIAYVVAFSFYRQTAPWIAGALSLPAYEPYQKLEFLVKEFRIDTYMYNAIAFALLFFGVKFLLGLTGRVLNWIALAPGIKSLNQWSGALLGLAEAAVLLVIAVQVMTVIPDDSVQNLLKTSRLAPYILEALPVLTNGLHELWSKSTAAP